MGQNCTIYHIDNKTNIIYLSDSWDDVASQYNAGALTAEFILNKNLFDFITDYDCLHIYRILIDKVQQNKVSIKFPFRCDVPATRRFMEMEVFFQAPGITGFKSCVIKEEAREPVAILKSTNHKLDKFLIICSWCMKIKVDEDSWLEVEEAITQLGLFDDALLPQLSHGICPACFADMMADLDGS